MVGSAQDGPTDSGAVHIFELDGNLITTVQDPNPDPRNWFGWASGATPTLADGFLVSSIFDPAGGNAYIIGLDGEVRFTFPRPDGASTLGKAFATFEDSILIADNFADGGFPDGFGAVWLYEPVAPTDFDSDGNVDVTDIDILCTSIARDSTEDLTVLDLTGDGVIDSKDVSQFLGEVGSAFGDANLDGRVRFDDFLTLSDNFGDDGTWVTGDFDCNGHVAFADFLLLSDDFGQGENDASVPEPSTYTLQAILLLFLFSCGRNRTFNSVSRRFQLRVFDELRKPARQVLQHRFPFPR